MINVKTSRPYDFFTFTVNFTAAFAPYYTLGSIVKNTFAVTPNISIASSNDSGYVYITFSNYTDFYGPYDAIELETSLENVVLNNAESMGSVAALNLADPTLLVLRVNKLEAGPIFNDYKVKVTFKKYLVTPTYASYVQTAYTGVTITPLNWSNLVY